MLFSLIMRFVPLQDFDLSRNPGPSLHALFFNLLRAADPVYAESLHDQVGLRPFTISPIFGREGVQRAFSAGEPCRIRFTCLSNDPYSKLGEYFMGYCEPVRKLHINGTPIKLEEIALQEAPGSHSGITDYEDIWNRARTDLKIVLQFRTPTTFRHGDINLPMPLPGFVFQGLASKWQHFAGDKYPINGGFAEFVDRCVFPTRFNIQSEILDYGWNKRFLGFTGVCVFGVQQVDADNLLHVKQLNMLADFAYYAGVGQKTTMGMGQVRRALAHEVRGPV